MSSRAGMRVFLFQQPQEDQNAAGCPDRADCAADIADVGNGGISTDHAADQRPASDSQIENAGIDGHCHRSGFLRSVVDDLRLKRHAVSCDGGSPEDAQQQNGP